MPGKVKLDCEPCLAGFAYFLYLEVRDLPLFSYFLTRFPHCFIGQTRIPLASTITILAKEIRIFSVHSSPPIPGFWSLTLSMMVQLK